MLKVVSVVGPMSELILLTQAYNNIRTSWSCVVIFFRHSYFNLLVFRAQVLFRYHIKQYIISDFYWFNDLWMLICQSEHVIMLTCHS